MGQTESMGEPITLQVIADHAGVSRALVSMALRNSPKVAKGTRDRIQLLANELGYRSNPMVQALMTEVRQRRKCTYHATLAFITNHETSDFWKQLQVYPEYFDGAKSTAERLGYQIEHFWLGEHRANPNRLVEILKARGIPGVLIPPLPLNTHRLNLDLSQFSAVTFGYSLKYPHVPRVCNNHVQTMRQAIEQLAQRNYRHIGIAISNEESQQVNYLWQAGLGVGQHLHPKLKFSKLEAKSWTETAFRHWFNRLRPEVIIAQNNKVWEWVQRLDQRVPEDVGVLLLDCKPEKKISGMHQNTFKQAGAAAELLASRVERNVRSLEEQPSTLMLLSDFHEGQTLRPLSVP